MIKHLLVILILFLTIGTSSASIYGFWEFPLSPTDYSPDWNKLTHVIYISWGEDGQGTLQKDGSLDFPPLIVNYNEVLDETHSHGKKLLICVSSRDADTIDAVLANNQDVIADNINNMVKEYNADGVNFDFEWIRDTNSINGLQNKILLESLLKKIDSKNDCIISICVDNGVTGANKAWYNSNINQYVDSVYLCAYDYSTPWNNKYTGPNSPFNDKTRFDVVESVSLVSKYYDKNKIILGLPFYGYDFKTTSKSTGSKFQDYSYIDLKDTKTRYENIWDSKSNTPWYRYKSGRYYHQVWYDDSRSLRLKIDYAKSQKLGGVGFWALGMEPKSIWKTVSYY